MNKNNNRILYLLSFRDSGFCDPVRGSALSGSLFLSQVILQHCPDSNEKTLENNVYARRLMNTSVQINEQLHFAGTNSPPVILVHV